MRIYYDEHHASHAPAAYVSRGQVKPCPEMPDRADILLDAVQSAGHDIMTIGSFGMAPVRAVHDARYLRYLEHAWSQWEKLPDHSEEVIPNVHPGRNMRGKPKAVVGLAGYYHADCASPIGPGTWDGILVSANTALSAAKFVMEHGSGAYAYALCRPPGHHAYADMAGGFCFLNNTAIAAQYCRDHGAERVAVLDVDVHHGNGTQGIFYSRADVLTVSLHGDPAHFYPFFAGYVDEAGEGDGEGRNVNIPLRRGTADDAYIARLEAALERVREFAPDVLVLALGLDASGEDPLAFLNISTGGFARIGAAVGALALPTVLIQEGGYVSPSLGDNLISALGGFEGER